jgi:hypothetical protein
MALGSFGLGTISFVDKSVNPLDRWTISLNVLLFVALAAVGFSYAEKALFHGLDGTTEITILRSFLQYSTHLFGYSSDPIRGLGDIEYPVNPALIPAYSLALRGSTLGPFSFVVVYTICAAELFIATYAFGRFFGFSQSVCLAGAWILGLLTWQIVSWPPSVPSTWRAFPHYATMLACGLLLTSAFLWIGRVRPAVSICLGTLVFLIISYLVVAAPALIILIAPPLLILSAASLFAAKSRREMIEKLIAAAVIFAACSLIGYLHFLNGLFSYTAAAFFKALSVQPHTIDEISLLLWKPIWPPSQLFTSQRLLVGGGLIGAIIICAVANGSRRILGAATLLTELVYIGLGVANYFHPFWYAPKIWYFENFLMPQLSIAMAFLLVETASVTWHHLVKRLVFSSEREAIITTKVPVTALVLVPLAACLYFSVVHATSIGVLTPLAASYPQGETPITKILKAEIGYAPGERFRGRVAEMTGRQFPDEHDWYGGQWGDTPVISYWSAGNYNSGPGLWQFSIPTVTEYSQLMSPVYWTFVRRFFTYPEDFELRNYIATRVINQRLLAMIGVHFIITDLPVTGLKQRVGLHFPMTEQFRAGPLQELARSVDSVDFLLYELPDSNLGQYSPTDVHVIQSASGLLAALGDPKFDPVTTMLTQEEPPSDLVPAVLDRLEYGKDGGLAITAHSSGVSVLLLPIEFSHCLSLSANATAQAHLIRADLILSSIVFTGHLTATVQYYTSPFANSSCRVQDTADARALDMSRAFRDAKEYDPRPPYSVEK